ncbi:bifunctional Exoribonuclease [Babesia duncani]|uniref:Bifunctional Exoribonuclease n=1 Tax=Babesia duncani TaxID=323732 RepID=A0AAD9UQH1_9APIC|nr:bifunctional Exoribonuclease [Babesia duncani]
MPISVTVTILKGHDCFILDATSLEQAMAATQIALVFDQFGELHGILKLLGGPIPLGTLTEAIRVRFFNLGIFTRLDGTRPFGSLKG